VRIAQTLVKRHYELRAGGIKADQAISVVPSPLRVLGISSRHACMADVRRISGSVGRYEGSRHFEDDLGAVARNEDRSERSDSWIGSTGDAISPFPSGVTFLSHVFLFYYFSSPFLREYPLWRCLVRRAWRR